MTPNGWTQFVLYLLALTALAVPLGWYLTMVFKDRPLGSRGPFLRVEGILYRVCGVHSDVEMTWKQYAVAMLLFNGAGSLAVYFLQRLQGFLPLNPAHLGAVSPDCAFNTAASFATNTNWQSYGGETTMSYLTQMLGLTVQNFLSASTGIAVLIALVRGLTRRETDRIGNFWVDLTRSVLWVLLPLSLLLAVILVWQGTPQTFGKYPVAKLVQPTTEDKGAAVTEQTIAVGPVASQIAIKQLGTNGGGYFNVNSAHPFENPTPLTNFLEMLAILLISAALCFTFGWMVKDFRQGMALYAAMAVIFIGALIVCMTMEQRGNLALAGLGVDQQARSVASAKPVAPRLEQAGGNMEGKETRFGPTDSAIWAVATTAASNGSVNSMHDSFTPLGGLVPLWMIQLGEVVFGGVGSGLYGMIAFVLLTVFVAGLMVGRTPEYLGKKVESFEMKMASLMILIPPCLSLIGAAVGAAIQDGTTGLGNPGAHGFSEILYAFSSMSNNNGSAFAGLNANTVFYNTAGVIAMLIGRFGLAVPILAIAGSMARKRVTPPGPGTLPTHTPLFVVTLVFVILAVGALSFVPALALGPIVEHLQALP
jgi:potassium-transporting ATPase potassium-binding subunit